MRFPTALSAALALLAPLALLAALAQPVRAEKDTAAHPVVVAWSASPPWGYWQGTDPAGPDADLLRELAQNLGLALRFTPCRPDRCLDMLEQGLADLGVGLARTPEREEYLLFLEPPVRTAPALVFFAWPGQRPVKDWRDLYGKIIAVNTASAPAQRLARDSRLTLQPVNTARDALRLVLARKADLAGLGRAEADWWLARLSPGKALEQSPLVLDEPVAVHLALSRQSRLLDRKAAFEQALADLAANGTLERLRQEPARDENP